MFKMNFLKSFTLLLVLTPTAFAGAGGPTESEGAEGGAPRLINSIPLSTATPPQGPGSKSDTSLNAAKSMSGTPSQHILVPVTDAELQVAVTEAERVARQMYNEGTPFGALPPELLAHIARDFNLKDLLAFKGAYQKTQSLSFHLLPCLKLGNVPITTHVREVCCRFANLQHLDLGVSHSYMADGNAAIPLLNAICEKQTNQSPLPIKTLAIYKTPLTDDHKQDLSTQISKMPNLRVLDLSSSNIGPAGAATLAKGLAEQNQLRVFNMSGNNIGPAGAAALEYGLAEQKQLQVLDMSGNHIRPAGGAALARALFGKTQLQVLLLSRNYIGPEDVKVLAFALHMQGLRELDLSLNEAGPEGGNALAEALLVPSKNLCKLNLSSNYLGPTAFARLADALAAQRHLEELDLSFNQAGPEGGNALAAAFLMSSENLRKLKLSGNGFGLAATSRLADALAAQKHLEELYLSCNCNKEGQSGIAALAKVLSANIGLRKLCLESNLMGPESAKLLAPFLQKLKDLSELDLGHNRLGADGITLIAEEVLPYLTNLKKLNLSSNYSGTPGEQAINKALLLLPNLKEFRLESNHPEEKHILGEIALQS